VCVRKIAVGDLILVEDTGAEFRYAGNGKFVRTNKAGGTAKRCA
jgi:hypothetical protein